MYSSQWLYAVVGRVDKLNQTILKDNDGISPVIYFYTRRVLWYGLILCTKCDCKRMK